MNYPYDRQVTLGEDGSVDVTPAFAHHMMALIAHHVSGEVGDVDSVSLTTIIAVTAGYCAGITLQERGDAEKHMENVQAAFAAGMGVGMQNNTNLPKLNG